MSESLHLTRNGSILEITLDRPKANAIDAKTSFEMGEVFLNFRDDPQLRVAIITGAGEKFFSAGWDLKAAAEGEAPDADFGPGGFAGLTEIFNLDKPVIAAVNGYAFGGGFELALAADFIVCADNASFALPEAKIMAIHLEAVNHCLVSREEMRQYALDNQIADVVSIPQDGETVVY